jgi:acyl transferase domain-containing protein
MSIEQAVNGVAVIGMSGRFPGAPGVEALWSNLMAGVESISRFDAEDLRASGVDPRVLDDPRYVSACGALEGFDRFDPEFFGFAQREAELADPQLRLLLECAWEALENAGCDPARHPGRIGVYAGASMSTYLLRNLMSDRSLEDQVGIIQLTLGNSRDHLTTQVSYRLDLTGPSVAVQTACSTSLVAVHLAAQALLAYECDVALAGGVSVRVPHRAGYFYQEGGIGSRDGHCRAFDAGATGAVGGNGAGIVVLKRAGEAAADGDRVHAVIRGSAINNDGGQKIGYTAPSVDGQAQVIAEAQAVAEAPPGTIGYVEAHGTGTRLGDPIEFAALRRVFEAGGAPPGGCGLGSLKTNLGHLDAAAGVAGLIKAVLALQHGAIPPSLHFRAPNPEVPLAGSPFYVVDAPRPWPASDTPRRAGVSSFGMGGTNAHVVLEEAPPRPAPAPAAGPHLLLLSARTATALEAATDRLAEHLRAHPDAPLADVAYTLQTGRRAFGHRRALACGDVADALEALERRDGERVLTEAQERRGRPVAFLFPGQGAQYAGMAAGLYASDTVFRDAVDRCAELLRPHLGEDVRAHLFPAGDAPSGALDQTRVTQPALFTVEYALARRWMEWGVHPEALAGHSIGEYVAACLAGVFSLEDALAVVAARGRLMQAAPAGAMLAVYLGEDEVRPLLAGGLSLAAVNAPLLSVVSGPAEHVEALQARLEAQGQSSRRLATSHAFHSSMMDGVLDDFRAVVAGCTLRAPRIPFVSNVTGGWIGDDEATDPGYWVRHLRQTVRFAEGVATLLAEPDRVLLEVGPGSTLVDLAAQHPACAPETALASTLGHRRSPRPEAERLLAAAGRLWLAGAEVDWARLHAPGARRPVALPTYPFERRRCWIDPAGVAPPAAAAGNGRPVGDGAAVAVQAAEAPAAPVQVEDGVAAIWRELFGAPAGGADDFFAAGGTSLAAVQLLTRLRRTFSVDLTVRHVFEHPTPGQLAALIRAMREDGGRPGGAGAQPVILQAQGAAC